MVRWYAQHRWFTLVRGWYAWELQIGSFVLQWVHPEHRNKPCAEGHRLHIWRDHYHRP
jgi:hypothetical protein